MTKLDDILLGVGSIAFAMSAVWTYTVDNFFKDETELQSDLLTKKKYEDNETAAGDRAKALKKVQQAPFFVLWVAGLVLSILALTI
jgi:hypothetical protein